MDLKTIKKTELAILLDIVKVCDKYNINYYLDFGTLLGAVRHSGFIPWDDDIDISMTREDYNLFKQVYKSEDYTLADPTMNDNYPYLVPKVYSKKYKLKEKKLQHIDYDCGLWIDIFIADGLPDNKVIYILKKKFFYILYVFYKIWYYPNNFLFKLIRFFIPICFLKRKLFNYWSMYKPENSNRIIKNLDFKHKYITNASDYKEFTTGTFEGQQLKIPKNYHNILSSYYGDYMILPKIEDRYSAHEFMFTNQINNHKL